MGFKTEKYYPCYYFCSSISHFIGVYPLILFLDMGFKMLLQFVGIPSTFDLVKLIKQQTYISKAKSKAVNASRL